jgi:ABC-type cobalamin/Fe3+-siderophores transport system ATPase subunit
MSTSPASTRRTTGPSPAASGSGPWWPGRSSAAPASSSSILFLDEPTNGLDPAAEAALLDGLLRVNKETGLTIIFVTHFISLAARAATHVALFRQGAVAAGPRARTLTDAELSRTYGVDVQMSAEPDGAVKLRIGART